MAAELFISYGDNPAETVNWLNMRGARAVGAGIPGTPAALIFDHGAGTMLQMALVGDTLVYDGKTISVRGGQ